MLLRKGDAVSVLTCFREASAVCATPEGVPASSHREAETNRYRWRRPDQAANGRSRDAAAHIASEKLRRTDPHVSVAETLLKASDTMCIEPMSRREFGAVRPSNWDVDNKAESILSVGEARVLSDASCETPAMRRTGARLTVIRKGQPACWDQNLMTARKDWQPPFLASRPEIRLDVLIKHASVSYVRTFDLPHNHSGALPRRRWVSRAARLRLDALAVLRSTLSQAQLPQLVRFGEIPPACFCTAWCFCPGTEFVRGLALIVVRSCE
ncbi:hypothetical protein V8F20_000464 [Naviculisporaceae sp. PSN 640]